MPFSFTSEQKQTFLWLGFGLALVALLVLLGPILAPFIAAAILAYALNPAVDRLSSKHIGKVPVPRVLAVTIVILLLLAALLALVLIVLPVVQKEIPLLRDQIPILFSKAHAARAPRLQALGINIPMDSEGIRQLVTEYFSTSGDAIWSMVLASATVGGVAVLGWLVNAILVPVVLFYLLLDWHAILTHMRNAVPRRWVGKTVEMARETDALLAQYLRGQLAVMLVLAVYYSVALAIARFDVALPVGIITGLLVFIPYLGFGLGLILALISAVLQFDGLQGLIAVAIIYGIGQVLESFILTPRLVGERIGLHPVTVIFALLAFGHLFGFAGVLLALPATAVVSVALRHLRAQYIDSSFYRQS
jgi:predicted PurR-regulated permease PerM